MWQHVRRIGRLLREVLSPGLTAESTVSSIVAIVTWVLIGVGTAMPAAVLGVDRQVRVVVVLVVLCVLLSWRVFALDVRLERAQQRQRLIANRQATLDRLDRFVQTAVPWATMLRGMERVQAQRTLAPHVAGWQREVAHFLWMEFGVEAANAFTALSGDLLGQLDAQLAHLRTHARLMARAERDPDDR
jgi:hypothetical protein